MKRDTPRELWKPFACAREGSERGVRLERSRRERRKERGTTHLGRRTDDPDPRVALDREPAIVLPKPKVPARPVERRPLPARRRRERVRRAKHARHDLVRLVREREGRHLKDRAQERVERRMEVGGAGCRGALRAAREGPLGREKRRREGCGACCGREGVPRAQEGRQGVVRVRAQVGEGGAGPSRGKGVVRHGVGGRPRDGRGRRRRRRVRGRRAVRVRADGVDQRVEEVGERRVVLKGDVAVGAVREVVVREVGAARYEASASARGRPTRKERGRKGEDAPGHDDVVVEAVHLHVLEPPALVEALGDPPLLPPIERRRVEQAQVDLVRKGGGEAREERGRGRARVLARRAQVVDEEGDAERGVGAQGRVQGADLRAGTERCDPRGGGVSGGATASEDKWTQGRTSSVSSLPT